MISKFSYKKLLLKTAVFALVIFLNNLVFHNPIENIFYSVTGNISSFFNNKLVFISQYGRGILELNKILDENRTLKNSNNKLLADTARLEEIERENQILRTRLNIASDSGTELILANLFNMRSGQYASTFTIDQGSVEGVEDGMALISAENILVGIVAKTYKHTALIFTPEHPDISLSVKIQGRTVLARSRGFGDSVKLDLITSQDELEPGDLVVTVGSGKIPASLPVFKIDNIKIGGGDLFKEVTAKPILNRIDITKVFVIIN